MADSKRTSAGVAKGAKGWKGNRSGEQSRAGDKSKAPPQGLADSIPLSADIRPSAELSRERMLHGRIANRGEHVCRAKKKVTIDSNGACSAKQERGKSVLIEGQAERTNARKVKSIKKVSHFPPENPKIEDSWCERERKIEEALESRVGVEPQSTRTDARKLSAPWEEEEEEKEEVKEEKVEGEEEAGKTPGKREWSKSASLPRDPTFCYVRVNGLDALPARNRGGYDVESSFSSQEQSAPFAGRLLLRSPEYGIDPGRGPGDLSSEEEDVAPRGGFCRASTNAPDNASGYIAALEFLEGAAGK
ncbi:hypothetical protein KM043_003682 [Ampulex compressa]|nr:hypothetical protein KM043_003682 [Ampulex compressa]